MGIGTFFIRSLKKSRLARDSPTDGLLSIPNSPDRSNISLPRSQIDELRWVFQKFDANGDGKISSTELSSIMASLGHPASDEELRQMMKEADTDGDGFIDMNEFVELNIDGIDATAFLEDLWHAFMIFDADGNGYISPEELQTVLKCLGDNSTVGECRKMIRAMDRNGDGCIDFEEFKMMMTRPLPFNLRGETSGGGGLPFLPFLPLWLSWSFGKLCIA